MKKNLVMAYLAGLVTAPALLIAFALPEVQAAIGNVAMQSKYGKQAGVVFIDGQPKVINGKDQDKIIDVNTTPTQVDEVTVIVFARDTDPKNKEPNHEHRYDDGIKHPSASREEYEERHGTYQHCWIQVGGIWQQIHC